ncbi:uncharacterized protein LOC142506182 isoform X3 [Primulina tabacum]|uniref:uncharacterized protein LOC142506182 isoform X3 n=1 Tax=Primulina tabacum TaxID=48773 RepID=UPI003F597357
MPIFAVLHLNLLASKCLIITSRYILLLDQLSLSFLAYVRVCPAILMGPMDVISAERTHLAIFNSLWFLISPFLLKCDAAVRPFLSEKQLLVSVVAGVKLKDLQVLGTASMVADMGKHPGQLKDDVASPGGTSIAGIHELEKASFRGILMNAVVAASKRSRELSQS